MSSRIGAGKQAPGAGSRNIKLQCVCRPSSNREGSHVEGGSCLQDTLGLPWLLGGLNAESALGYSSPPPCCWIFCCGYSYCSVGNRLLCRPTCPAHIRRNSGFLFLTGCWQASPGRHSLRPLPCAHLRVSGPPGGAPLSSSALPCSPTG